MSAQTAQAQAKAKFLFDVDFASGADLKPTITVADHEAICAEREAAAFRNGVASAENKLNVNAAQRLAAAMAMIGEGIERLNRGLGDVEMRLESEAVEVAVAVANKLAPELIAREPFAEIAALASDCFQHLASKPHVVVRIGDALYANAKEKLDEIARARGFEGRLVLLAEPDIAAGDCKIEWADGGVSRDRNQTQAAIDEAVNRYVAARIVPADHSRSAS